MGEKFPRILGRLEQASCNGAFLCQAGVLLFFAGDGLLSPSSPCHEHPGRLSDVPVSPVFSVSPDTTHRYHHITVLLYCWHAYATRASSGLYFIAMNYSVHAVMYFYYFAMAVGMWPKWLNPIFITFFQVCFGFRCSCRVVCAC